MSDNNPVLPAKKSLVKRFVRLFVAFALGTIIVTSTMTYLTQTRSYHEDCVADLRKLTTHLTRLIQNEEDEFICLKQYFQEHPEKVQVPLDFRSELPKLEKKYNEYMQETYPGKVIWQNIDYVDLDEEGRRLYVNYRFAYWFKIFFDAVEEFDLSYVYFIYPENEQDHIMNYMFDPTLGTKTSEDGSEILILGDIVYEDPAIHKYMWDAWNSGIIQDGFDSLDNEYGHVYTYCVPLIINGEKLGLVCSEISVEYVNSEISSNVIKQGLVTALVLIIFTFILYLLLNSQILQRIIRIERGVRSYAEQKDPAVAGEISANAGDADEIGSLAGSFAGMITELEDHMINLQRVTAEKERIDADLSIASKIQADMLPKIFPPFPERKDIDIYATMNPAKEVGGDFYDLFLVDADHLALVIADVSGKGVPASLFMVIAKTLIKNRLQMGEAPAEALANVNNQLCEGNDAELFVTVWAVVIDLKTGDVREVNAGHEYPAFKKAGGVFELIKTKHSPAVATIEGLSFRETFFHMDPGDMLFVYTDGVTEATNKDMELFGEKRLLKALNGNLGAAPKELLPAIKKEIDDFVGEAPQFDDITMLAFTYLGEGE
ncbi:PP2C family protein-serine/threonine phosphatase [Butyrivibrio sp. MC2013]|uniref:PP2C family protein-serine/threonine phosphatase n=1 Tax=Butyrivibrio sp. MC2013 TaxID=1280686 RepID=UPI0004003405|nr:PP2C family protein-serine/threonine phosphatase [Butyrivibrio sp. MC2013]